MAKLQSRLLTNGGFSRSLPILRLPAYIPGMPLSLFQGKRFESYALCASNDHTRVHMGIPSGTHKSPQAFQNRFDCLRMDDPAPGRSAVRAPCPIAITSVTEDGIRIKRYSCQNEKEIVCDLTHNRYSLGQGYTLEPATYSTSEHGITCLMEREWREWGSAGSISSWNTCKKRTRRMNLRAMLFSVMVSSGETDAKIR